MLDQVEAAVTLISHRASLTAAALARTHGAYLVPRMAAGRAHGISRIPDSGTDFRWLASWAGRMNLPARIRGLRWRRPVLPACASGARPLTRLLFAPGC